MSREELENDRLRTLAARYWCCCESNIRVYSFGKGASGRVLCRLTHESGNHVVGVSWNRARSDNDAFVPIAQLLHQQDISVPAILTTERVLDAEGQLMRGYALVEDFGDIDLLSIKDASWSERKSYYVSALAQLHRLHGIVSDVVLQPSFDAQMYAWEQSYFAEHFLKMHLHKCDVIFSDTEEMQSLSHFLSARPRVPVHRDFQTQNIMLFEGKSALIDFQGMRMGLAEYDLASLLYDSYSPLTQGQREELIVMWEGITQHSLDREVFHACALQRLMQALGAFANIGYNTDKCWYLEQIPQGIKNLSEVLLLSSLANPWVNKIKSALV